MAAPIDGVDLMNHYYVMNCGEMDAVVRGIEQATDRKLTEYDLEIESWMLHTAGTQITAAEYSLSLAAWDRAAANMAHFHETYDFYITPATAATAPKVGELTRSREEQEQLREQMRTAKQSEQLALVYDMFLPSLTYTPFTQLANLTGQPAMSLPLHLSDEGLPLGVQVMAGKGEEHRLLNLAYHLEQSDLWHGMQGNPYMATAEQSTSQTNRR
ncbi:hypothetical protein G4V62_10010 [Bacillaceae bacterium SIJ1]|nr:hypothetical protein [Litoribacterium kuwaitense]